MLFLCFLLLFSKRTPIFALSSIRYRRRVFANFTVGIFYVHRLIYSSVPCGALMRPQPVSGARQRGAELFLSPLRVYILFIHFNALQK